MEHFRLLQTKVQDWGESTPNITVLLHLVSDTTLCCMWHSDFCVPQKTGFVKEKFFSVLKLTLCAIPECSFQKKFCSKWKHYGNYSPTSETIFSCYWVAVFPLGFVSENLNLQFVKMDKPTSILSFQCDLLHIISSSNRIGSFLNSPQALRFHNSEAAMCILMTQTWYGSVIG